ncbi:GNAT family N-acetyltransferase [Embleya sp. NPDC127516]|uniref:GNAT family N-acetyltransferase n=1 Tax=Embleya sp. NPDC127516 TaxID=3363990 RepID=UPI003811EE94
MLIRATKKDSDLAVEVLTEAFENDPFLRWLFPEDPQYGTYAPLFFGQWVDVTLDAGEIWMDPDRAGVMLGQLSTTLASNEEDKARAREEFRATFRECADRVVAFVDGVAENHPNMDREHWYWTMLGVRRSHQRKGVGRAIFQELFEMKNPRYPFYCEATTSGNLALYRRLGFRRLFEFRVAPDASPLQAIWAETNAFAESRR